MTDWIWAARLADVAEDTPNIFTFGSRTIALYRGRNPCDQWSLCALHYAVFEIATGRVISGPTTGPLAVYPTRVAGDDAYAGSRPSYDCSSSECTTPAPLAG